MRLPQHPFQLLSCISCSFPVMQKFQSSDKVGPKLCTTGAYSPPPCRKTFRGAKHINILSSAEDADGPWFSAAKNQPCNSLCMSQGYDECGKEEMAAINSSETLETLLSVLNLTCTQPPSGNNEFRTGGGSPFYRDSPDPNDCYYWDPSAPAASVDCDSVSGTRRPLCYCKNVTALPLR